MLMLEARNICGGATGRNGKYRACRDIPFSYINLVNESRRANTIYKAANFVLMPTPVIQHGLAVLVLMAL